METKSRLRHKQRSTRQRTAILHLLQEAESFLSAQEMYDALRKKDLKVGLTTVYRNLQMMADMNEVDVVRREDGESIFRLCDADDHHHHLVCRSCGFTVELANDQLEKWAKALAKKHRFSDVTHDMELFGLCRTCSRRP
ncbi:MAG TPA: transcriptional repressor [Actinomycetota bacterium]|nr:transcriptional repressor [Actinomycetota bacterium]